MRPLWTCISIFFGAMFISISVSADSAIFVRDDRQYVSTAPGSYYSPIGQVFRMTLLFVGRTTGTLVDDCHVLTARHIYGYGKAVIGRHLYFEGAFGTPQQTGSWGRVVAAGRPLQKPATMGDEIQQINDDWLLIRLDTCLGKSLGHADLFAGSPELYPSFRVQDAGYPIDRNSRRGLTIDPSCKVVGFGSNGAVMNDCAVKFGNSGGPLFRVIEENGRVRLQVLGIQTFGTEPQHPIPEDDFVPNGATPVSAFGPLIRDFLSL